jgi:cytochrome c peroxidase
LQQTIERLGGAGLAKRRVAALAAYLTAMPPVRAPTRDPQAIARGEELFESAKLGCTQCHDGPAYTDRERHQLPHQADVDTPSLRGLAASAPYFHDGSAPTLETVVRDRGRIHGMADGAAGLTDAELRDLVAFLETR